MVLPTVRRFKRSFSPLPAEDFCASLIPDAGYKVCPGLGRRLRWLRLRWLRRMAEILQDSGTRIQS